jgi:hypothetical protein
MRGWSGISQMQWVWDFANAREASICFLAATRFLARRVQLAGGSRRHAPHTMSSHRAPRGWLLPLWQKGCPKHVSPAKSRKLRCSGFMFCIQIANLSAGGRVLALAVGDGGNKLGEKVVPLLSAVTNAAARIIRCFYLHSRRLRTPDTHSLFTVCRYWRVFFGLKL